jgi:integrase
MPKIGSFNVTGLYREASATGARYRIDLRYRDPSGVPQRHRERLPKGTSEKAAIARALYLVHALPSGEYDPNAREALTLRGAVEEYNASQAAEGLPIAKARASHLRAFLDWARSAPSLAKRGRDATPLEKLAPVDVEAYRRHLRAAGRGRGHASAAPASGCSVATVNRHVATIKHLAGWARTMGHAPRDWAARIREDVRLYDESDRARTRHLSTDELGRVLDALATLGPRSAYLRPIVEAALGTGARIGELAKLRWADVDLERAELTFKKTKTKRTRTVKAGAALLETLDELARASGRPAAGFVFPIPVRRLPASSSRKPRDEGEKRRDTVSRAWARFASEIGLVDFHAHDLRHSAATSALRSGASLAHVRRLLGHTTIITTQRYAHVEVDDLATMADRIAVRATRGGSVDLPPDPAGQPMPQGPIRAAARAPETHRRRPDSNRCMKVLQTFA